MLIHAAVWCLARSDHGPTLIFPLAALLEWAVVESSPQRSAVGDSLRAENIPHKLWETTDHGNHYYKC